ncbi:MAG: hypothetical protein NTX91_02030 [candidate division SR1 bacterium]|nr:hypothetical protein [candidate division SR1 bacterium]
MKKILVVYYSRTGITKSLALSIANLVNADIEELIDKKKRKGLFGHLVSGRDAALRRQTTIQNFTNDPSAYDIVYIGTPVWDFTMAAAVRTFLIMYEKTLPASLVFFCTQASSGADSTIQEMATLSGKRPIATIICSSKDIEKNSYQEDIENQLDAIGLLKSI